MKELMYNVKLLNESIAYNDLDKRLRINNHEDKNILQEDFMEIIEGMVQQELEDYIPERVVIYYNQLLKEHDEAMNHDSREDNNMMNHDSNSKMNHDSKNNKNNVNHDSDITKESIIKDINKYLESGKAKTKFAAIKMIASKYSISLATVRTIEYRMNHDSKNKEVITLIRLLKTINKEDINQKILKEVKNLIKLIEKK